MEHKTEWKLKAYYNYGLVLDSANNTNYFFLLHIVSHLRKPVYAACTLHPVFENTNYHNHTAVSRRTAAGKWCGCDQVEIICISASDGAVMVCVGALLDNKTFIKIKWIDEKQGII